MRLLRAATRPLERQLALPVLSDHGEHLSVRYEAARISLMEPKAAVLRRPDNVDRLITSAHMRCLSGS